MKKNLPLYLSLACLLLTTNCQDKSASSSNQSATITLAVAANMQFAMKELTEAFREKTGIHCEVAVSSSGKLTAQIKKGAPFDVFISADMKYPREIERAGMAATQARIYAYGKLVLWSMKDGILPSLAILGSESTRHIALANPKTAPYGVAALETLKSHQLLEAVEHKLVYGESIAQTNQFITTQSAELGFTAMSVVLSPEIKGQGQWVEIDRALYPPIEQGIVVIKQGGEREANALKFYDFLFSEKAHQILEAFGYAIEGL